MKQVVIIGSGNVATSLAHGLSARCVVAQIFSRQLFHARLLADAIGCPLATDDLMALVPDADAYIVAVRDDVIADVVGHRAHYGVLWPMQSFSREVVVALDDVHFFAEASDKKTLEHLMALGHMISHHVIEADSDKRRRLHVASVFSCNFANHMWALADEVLGDAGLPFDALLPLIRTTVDKLSSLSPAKSQTGPAIRHDTQVLDSHLAMLDGDKREIYRLLSDSIMNRNPLDDNAK